MTVTVYILTLNAEKTITSLLNYYNYDHYNVVVIDSSSSDRTVKICEKYDCSIVSIDRSDFNHGATREYARKLTDSEIVVFFTQDVMPASDETIEKLILPIINGEAHVSYARQLHNKNADIFESFSREYNYGTKEHIRSIADINKYGIYTFFCSNSCAAWSNKVLDEIGGFKSTLTNEDYFACAGLLLNGYKVAYVADAIVTHSHKYTLLQEFRRMFDTGYVRAERSWVQDAIGHAEKRGTEYFKALINKLWVENPLLIPYAFLQITIKYLGYKLGFHGKNLPTWIKKSMSSQKYYWDSKYCE